METLIFGIVNENTVTGLHANCAGCQHIVHPNRCIYQYTPAANTSWPCWFRTTCTAEMAQETIKDVARITKDVYRGPNRKTPAQAPKI